MDTLTDVTINPAAPPAARVVALAAGNALADALTALHPALTPTDFRADAGELLPVIDGDRRLYLLGLGSNPTPPDVLAAFRNLAHRHADRWPAALALDLRTPPAGIGGAGYTDAALNGFLLGGYRMGRYKTDAPTPTPPALAVLTDAGQEVVRRARATAHVQQRVLDLVNAPGNQLTPTLLAHWAVDSGRAHGYQVQVFDQSQLETLGAGALLAVGKGSAEPPALIVAGYRPPNARGPHVVLVGKGITFDTGGISIKPSANLHYMKCDMGGAAAVLGAIELAARLQLPVAMSVVVPAAENGVDGLALKPGDVIDSLSGKRIEVIDTDAEGRLVLADGLAYAVRELAPDVLIDVATLTGSCVAALGYHAGGLFTNNDALANQLLAAGQATGERLWRLPLWDVYKEDIHSDVADVRNFSGKPVAGAITAGKFLEVFTDHHPHWAHLDVAGVAFGDSAFAKMKSATAWGVRLLTTFVERAATGH